MSRKENQKIRVKCNCNCLRQVPIHLLFYTYWDTEKKCFFSLVSNSLRFATILIIINSSSMSTNLNYMICFNTVYKKIIFFSSYFRIISFYVIERAIASKINGNIIFWTKFMGVFFKFFSLQSSWYLIFFFSLFVCAYQSNG